MSDPFIGQIIMFGGNFAPRGWAFCDGQLLQIATNSALFSILGTTYGGDGRTNFGLPDLRGRVPIHNGAGVGLDSYRLGQKGGSEEVTLATAQLPSHSHDLQVADQLPNTNEAGSGLLTKQQSRFYSDSGAASTMPDAISATGGAQAVDLRQPYLAVNYIIALVGVFPPRS